LQKVLKQAFIYVLENKDNINKSEVNINSFIEGFSLLGFPYSNTWKFSFF